MSIEYFFDINRGMSIEYFLNILLFCVIFIMTIYYIFTNLFNRAINEVISEHYHNLIFTD